MNDIWRREGEALVVIVEFQRFWFCLKSYSFDNKSKIWKKIDIQTDIVGSYKSFELTGPFPTLSIDTPVIYSRSSKSLAPLFPSLTIFSPNISRLSFHWLQKNMVRLQNMAVVSYSLKDQIDIFIGHTFSNLVLAFIYFYL